MTGITLDKGAVVYECGQPMTAFHLITDGKIKVNYPGGSYQLGKGDVIGICEICSEVHFLHYEVTEDATILTYSFANLSTLEDLMDKHPDVARLFLLSAFSQTNLLLDRCSLSEITCSSFYQSLQEDYEKYQILCKRYRMIPRSLEDFNSFSAYLGESIPDLWLAGFYQGLIQILSGDGYKPLVANYAIPSGFLRKCSLDYRKAYTTLEEQAHYLEKATGYYLNSSGNDLLDFYTSLYFNLGQDCGDSDELFTDINRMSLQLESSEETDLALLKTRMDTFHNNLALLQDSSSSPTEDIDAPQATEQLINSLNTILSFAGDDLDLAASFRRHVQSYKQLEDRFSTDESCSKLRGELTQEFYALYALIFKRTLDEPVTPAPVKMFLYFGYVDEELAGIANATYLYRLSEGMTDHSSQGVYTLYDWLLAIYQGKKEPSRNEFDQDYNDYIHKQNLCGNISDAELRSLEQNTMAKVNYELRNMFPVANKMTYGRITSFCPIFTSEDVLKKLEDSYVTVSTVSRALEQIQAVDYSVFYRESLDKKNIDVMGKETIHLEYLPDIILMPNAGVRGVMWQEIEGKVRNTSSRMLLSVFHMEDCKMTLLRLCGEFRWELCKRIQGSRWNDISDKSLTSEYSDYAQFYRKNHDLSSEAKEKVRASLQRSKNSFKEMFIRDYIIWVMFEGNGSPRLNKVARKILFTYCPFPKDIRDSLKQNPLYAELLGHYDIQVAQRLHRLDMLSQKLKNGRIPLPDTLDKERHYIEGTLSS